MWKPFIAIMRGSVCVVKIFCAVMYCELCHGSLVVVAIIMFSTDFCPFAAH